MQDIRKNFQQKHYSHLLNLVKRSLDDLLYLLCFVSDTRVVEKRYSFFLLIGRGK